MNDLIRPSLYGAYHDIRPVNEDAVHRPKHSVDVVGPVCESGDFLAKDRSLPEVKPGELLAVMSAGAYGFVMASNYNSRPRVPEVLGQGRRDARDSCARDLRRSRSRRDDSCLLELTGACWMRIKAIQPFQFPQQGVSMFTGSLVAIVTPFRKGKVDERAFGDLIEWQIANGTNGIVPCGTTGESATLSHDEHNRVIELTVEVVKRPGAGHCRNRFEQHGRSHLAHQTCQGGRCRRGAAHHALLQQADAGRIVSPLQGRCRGRRYAAGALQHSRPHRSQHVAGDGRAARGDEEYRRQSRKGSGSVQQASDIVQTCGDRLTVLAGDDALTLPMMAVGAKGVITVTANIMPKEMAQLVASFQAGRIDEARRIHFKLSPLFAALFYRNEPHSRSKKRWG